MPRRIEFEHAHLLQCVFYTNGECLAIHYPTRIAPTAFGSNEPMVQVCGDGLRCCVLLRRAS